jgi:hypothetical protein
MNYIFGPLPVPTGQLMNCIVYPFLVTDETSSDSRVRKSGRSCSLIILIRRTMKRFDEARLYLENYLPNWFESKNKVTPKNLKQLSNLLTQHKCFQPPVDELLETDKTEDELKITLLEQQNKLMLFEQIIEMDTLSKTLVRLYETNPYPTVEQVSKLSGISKLFLNRNLRKFVKAGIITIEDNRIRFNTAEEILESKISKF